jgi:hypothetical protein
MMPPEAVPVFRHARSHKFAVTLLLCLAGCVVQPANDTALASRLQDKWSASRYIGSGTRDQSIDLRPDGTFLIAGVLRNVQGALNFHASGSWRVQDGYLIFKITQADGPGEFAQGERRARIVSVSDWELVTTDGDTGLEQRAWRYPK